MAAIRRSRSCPPPIISAARSQALAATHTLIAESEWQPSRLGDIIAKQLGAYASRPDAGSLSAPAISFDANAALGLSLIFHELVTNASKYGALTAIDGRVEVNWEIGDQFLDEEIPAALLDVVRKGMAEHKKKKIESDDGDAGANVDVRLKNNRD